MVKERNYGKKRKGEKAQENKVRFRRGFDIWIEFNQLINLSSIIYLIYFLLNYFNFILLFWIFFDYYSWDFNVFTLLNIYIFFLINTLLNINACVLVF